MTSRFSPRMMLGPGLVTLVMVAGGCSQPVAEVTVDDRLVLLQDDLMADGASLDVAECVGRLAAHDLRTGSLDPVVRDELLINCERAEEILDGGQVEEDRPLAFADGPDTLGDDPDLDRLWLLCADGSGRACDDLFARSPAGSGYERFGVSCGDRPDVLDCRELDEPDDVDG